MYTDNTIFFRTKTIDKFVASKPFNISLIFRFIRNYYIIHSFWIKNITCVNINIFKSNWFFARGKSSITFVFWNLKVHMTNNRVLFTVISWKKILHNAVLRFHICNFLLKETVFDLLTTYSLLCSIFLRLTQLICTKLMFFKSNSRWFMILVEFLTKLHILKEI